MARGGETDANTDAQPVNLNPPEYNIHEFGVLSLDDAVCGRSTDRTRGDGGNYVDLHNMNPQTAKAALIVWLRFLKSEMQQTGSSQVFGPNCHHVFIVTGT